MKKSVPLWAVLMTVMISGALVFAAIKFSYDISSMVGVEAAYNLTVYDFATKTTIISSYNFGELNGPGNFTTTPEWAIKNIGNVKTCVGWSVTNLPAGFSLTCELYYSGLWKDWPKDRFNFPPDEFTWLQPGQFYCGADGKIRFTLINTAAPAGDFTFQVKIQASDTTS